MKNLKVFLMVVGLMLGSLAGLAIAGESYRLTQLYYEPAPAEPGKEVTVWFKIDNTATTEVNNLMVEFVDEFPFSLVEEDKRSFEIERLPTRKYVLVSYRVLVDRMAAEGINYMKLRVTYGMLPPSTERFEIMVKPQKPTISVDSILASPEIVSPGMEFGLKIDVSNSEEFALKNLRTTLDFTGMPFSPIRSSNYKSFPLIASGEKKSIGFQLIASPDAEPGVYSIPLVIEYQDNLNNNYVENHVVGFVVQDIFERNILAIPDEFRLSEGVPGKVSLQFVNRGLSRIKSMEVRILPSDGYSISGKDIEYLGIIEYDDYDLAEFTIVPERTGEISVRFEYEYFDYFNNKITETRDVIVNVSEHVESRSIMPLVIVLLVVGVVAWVLYRRWKKKNE
ncbi:MAG TPA: hypothetical protein ENN46_03070 [Candidatus Woesearchaeota archaeon]|nr:hypothetical protein [Candidatus Woesearchaeota archaeon]